MTIALRSNCDFDGFTEDYAKVRAFLVRLANPNYLFGRWDWMYTHLLLDRTGLAKIGMWEDDGELVALALYDGELGEAYFSVLDGYRQLLPELLAYARRNLSQDGGFLAMIPDSDPEFQDVAADLGYVPTQEREMESCYPIRLPMAERVLPEGFTIFSLADNCDVYRYGEVLWKGFNHEVDGEGSYDPTESTLRALENELRRPNVNLDLKIAVAAPNGDFVSYCGMWQDPGCEIALVEPVATVPEYRRLGLGKAAVLEGIARCAALGAKRALVGSSQQFYYSIGFRPFSSSTWWKPA